MRTVEKVLAELRELARNAARGQNVSKRRAELETALVIEESQAPDFTDDVTTFRAVERYGAAFSRPSAYEVIDGTDLIP